MQGKGSEDIMPLLPLKFLHLIDKLIAIMCTEHADLMKLIDICDKLRASNADQISLFDSDFMRKLRNLPHPFILKLYLLPFMTWFDHSILRVLVDSSGNKEAIQLVDQFDSCLDYNQPIAFYDVPEYSQLTLPCKGNKSEFTLLVTKYLKSHNEIMLLDLLNVKKELTIKWEITDHSIHLVAMHSKFSYFYWLIPRKLQPLIEDKLRQDQHELWDKGITSIALLPDNYLSDDCIECKVGCKFNFMEYNAEVAKKVRTYIRMYICILYVRMYICIANAEVIYLTALVS